jgi:hypothetical protein
VGDAVIHLQDRYTVTPVKGNGARVMMSVNGPKEDRKTYLPYVENTRNSSIGSEANQVDGNAKEDGNPDSI